MRAWWIGALGLMAAGQAEAGLTLCNDTATRASVAIAYAADGVWTSEGWWGIDPAACALVESDDLKQRHYYFTLSNDPDFAGEGYSFCVQTAPFTLTGADGDCGGLSAESRAFSHIDTGAEGTDFTFRIATAPDAPAPAPLEPQIEDLPAPNNDLTALWTAAAAPSFERGQTGEPFLVNAINQGCQSIEGDEACLFYAEGARWIAYDHGQNNAAAMDLLAALPVGAAVDVSGDLVFFGDITAEANIASIQPGNDPYATTRAAMQGLWVSDDDPQSKIDIYGSEQTDTYGDELLATSILTLGNTCGEASSGILLSAQMLGGDPMDMLCYEVVSVDANRMELIYLGRGNTLTYVRP